MLDTKKELGQKAFEGADVPPTNKEARNGMAVTTVTKVIFINLYKTWL